MRRVLVLPMINKDGIELPLNEMLKLCCYVNKFKAEHDPEFRQVIPYMTLVDRSTGEVAAYHRQGSEERLHGNMSIGFGGHVEFGETLFDAAARELEEEAGVSIGDCHSVQWNEDRYIIEYETMVDKVHLGVHGLIVVDREKVKSSSETGRILWLSGEELLQHSNSGDLEKWSDWVITEGVLDTMEQTNG